MNISSDLCTRYHGRLQPERYTDNDGPAGRVGTTLLCRPSWDAHSTEVLLKTPGPAVQPAVQCRSGERDRSYVRYTKHRTV